MTIETFGDGGWVATGKDVDLVRLFAIRYRLELEMQGIRFKGPATGNAARAVLGTSEKRKAKLVQMLNKKIDEAHHGE